MDIENLNHRYWKEMAIYSTKKYCRKMLELCSDPYEICNREDFEDSSSCSINLNSKVDRYLNRVIELDKAHLLKEHLDELEEEFPFPSEIKGYLHEYTNNGENTIFQPLHLMYKLYTKRDEEHKVTFEFLIEYGLLESDVEIYYGIKAISDNPKTTPEFAEYVQSLSHCWFEMIRLIKSNTLDKQYSLNKKYEKKYNELKFTNNVHNGTFWITWGRVREEEDWSDIMRFVEDALYNKAFDKLIQYHKEFGDLSRSKLNKGLLSTPVSLETLIKDIIDKNAKIAEDKKEHRIWLERKDDGLLQEITIDDIRERIKNSILHPSDFQTSSKVNVRTYVTAYLTDACHKKDKQDPNGLSILSQNDNGTYRFNCNNNSARLFIESLYNPDEILLANYISEQRGDEKYYNVNEKLKEDVYYQKISGDHIDVGWNIVRALFLSEKGKKFPKTISTTQFILGDEKFNKAWKAWKHQIIKNEENKDKKTKKNKTLKD